ncbi:MAG: hypothetical protein QOE70_3619 [Chthoniobacter sp.]|jgi:hypothetical protein|nr:hypothetical protein [Chthoniobacter sp.]
MRILSAALMLVLFVACEKKPTEEEVEAKKEEARTAAARATPTPKPGDWMWKQYNNPLDKKPKDRH